MIIFILLFLLKLVIAFILWLVMAVGIQVALSGISKTHSSIDPYAIAIIWWTIIFMAGLAHCNIASIPLYLGAIPVALAHCRVARNPHSRHAEFYVIIESMRNVSAPFIALRTWLIRETPTIQKMMSSPRLAPLLPCRRKVISKDKQD